MPDVNLKTRAPEIPPFAIHRHGLIQTLKSNARKRMIFVVAAGGWGKSTLLASYAQTLSCPCLWYNVEPSDQDPAVFLSLLASGLYQIIPQEKKALLPPLMAFKQGGSDPMSLFRHLFNTILNDPSQKMVLIFDDYHLAGTSPRFDSAFRKLVEKAPLNLHLVVAGREDPGLLRSECSKTGEALTLTSGQLKFSPEEIKLFFKQNYAVDLFQGDITRIVRQTEGWPAGLRLTSERLAVAQRDNLTASLLDQRMDADMVEQYFQERLDSALPATIGRFLAKAAIFYTFTPQACATVLGWIDAEEHIGRMASTGLFVIRLDPERRIYRFHHLFRKFLLDRLAGYEEEIDIADLHRHAASYYTQQEQWHEAAYHFITAKAYQDAAIILRQHIRDFISKGSAESLLQLLEQMPYDVLNKDAALLYAHGWALFLIGRWNDAQKTLLLAKDQSLIDKEMMIYGRIVQLLMVLNFSLDDFKTNQQLAIESHQYLPQDAREAVLIDTQLAGSLMHLGQPAAAGDVWQRIQDHPLVKTDVHLYMETMPLMAFNYHYFLGDLQAALSLLDKAINHFRAADYMGRLGRSLFFKGAISHEMGEYGKTRQLLDEAAREALKTGDRSLLMLILSLSSVNAIALGDKPGARELLTAAEKVFADAPEQRSWKECFFYWAEAMNAYHFNQTERFFTSAGKAMHSVEKKKLWMDQYLIGCSFALPYLKLGRPDLAAELMQKVLAATTILKDSYPQARAHLLMAAVQNALGKIDRTLDHLREAIDIGKARNYDFLFLRKEAEPAGQLLPLALDHHFHLDFTAYLLVRLNNNSGLPILPLLEKDDPELRLVAIRISTDLGCRDVENRISALIKDKDRQVRQQAEKAVARIQMLPPIALHVSTLGRFGVIKGEFGVSNTVWRRKLAKSIAKFLIVHADREFTGEQLIDIFLPDAMLEEGRQLLNQAITVVRRAFEPGIAPKRESAYLKSQHGTYRFSLPEGSSVDLFAFEKLCQEAARAHSKLDRFAESTDYSKALELYKGDFLPEDLYQQWTVPIRDQARSMYLRALYATAEAYHHRLEFERCIIQIQHLLREEPWDEKAYLLLMKCYFALGDRPRLIKTFQTCTNVLMEELDITPSEPLQRFYDQAVGS